MIQGACGGLSLNTGSRAPLPRTSWACRLHDDAARNGFVAVQVRGQNGTARPHSALLSGLGARTQKPRARSSRSLSRPPRRTRISHTHAAPTAPHRHHPPPPLDRAPSRARSPPRSREMSPHPLVASSTTSSSSSSSGLVWVGVTFDKTGRPSWQRPVRATPISKRPLAIYKKSPAVSSVRLRLPGPAVPLHDHSSATGTTSTSWFVKSPTASHSAPSLLRASPSYSSPELNSSPQPPSTSRITRTPSLDLCPLPAGAALSPSSFFTTVPSSFYTSPASSPTQHHYQPVGRLPPISHLLRLCESAR